MCKITKPPLSVQSWWLRPARFACAAKRMGVLPIWAAALFEGVLTEGSGGGDKRLTAPPGPFGIAPTGGNGLALVSYSEVRWHCSLTVHKTKCPLPSSSSVKIHTPQRTFVAHKTTWRVCKLRKGGCEKINTWLMFQTPVCSMASGKRLLADLEQV